AEAPRRSARAGRAQQRRERVLEPAEVADAPRGCGPQAGEDLPMPRGRFRHRVILVSVGEHCAFGHELPQPARELGFPSIQIVRTQLINGDDDNQLRPGGCGRRPTGERREEDGDGKDHGDKLVSYVLTATCVGASSRICSVKYATTMMKTAEPKQAAKIPTASNRQPTE